VDNLDLHVCEALPCRVGNPVIGGKRDSLAGARNDPEVRVNYHQGFHALPSPPRTGGDGAGRDGDTLADDDSRTVNAYVYSESPRRD
jgi:hypothetical protein